MLLKNTRQLLSQHKYLFGVGLFVAFTGGSAGGLLSGFLLTGLEIRRMISTLASYDGLTYDSIIGSEEIAIQQNASTTGLLAAAGGLIIVLLCVGVFSLIISAVSSRIAQGMLIAGADNKTVHTFSSALNQSWKRTWHLIIIISIPPIPITLSAIFTVLFLGGSLYLAGLAGNPEGMLDWLDARQWLWIVILIFNTPFILLTLILGLLQIPADRFCVFAAKRPVESFREAWRLFRKHIGGVLGLALIQMIAGMSIGLLLHIPAHLYLPLTCVIQPVSWIINGIFIAFFTVLWTMAWQTWSSSEMTGE